MEALADEALRRMWRFSVNDLMKLVYGFVAVGCRHMSLLDAVAEAMDWSIQHFSLQGLVHAAWFFATLASPQQKIMTSIAQEILAKLDRLSVAELAKVAWSFATLRLRHGRLMQGIAIEAGNGRNPVMAAGLQHTLLLCSDGDAVACGKNDMGQCEIPELPDDENMPARRYIGASAGINHTLLLRDDGHVVAFGGRSEGQCEVPVLPEGLRYIQAAAGYCFSIIIRDDGEALAFGENTAGQCNIPSLPPGQGYVAASASRTHAVLLREDGHAVSWGYGLAGECKVPELPNGTRYVDIAAGGNHTVLVRSDGVALAFGHNGAGQCEIPDLPEGLRYVACAAAWTHTVLLRDDGEVLAVGGNGRGQCNVPPLAEGTSYVSVAAGGAHTLLLRSDGLPVLFGDNRCGQCSPPDLHSSVWCVPNVDPQPVVVVTLLAEDGRLSAHSASGAQRAELTLQPMALLPLRRWLAARLQLPPQRLQLEVGSKPWRLPVEAGAAASSRKQIHEEQKRPRMDLNAVRLPAKKTGNGSAALQCSGPVKHLRKVQLHVLPERVQRLGGLDGRTLSRIRICIKHAQKNCNHLILNSSIIAEEFADELWTVLRVSQEFYMGYDCQVVCPQCGHLAPVTETPKLQRVVVPGSEGSSDPPRHSGIMLFFGGHVTFFNCFVGSCFADRSMKFLEISRRSEVRHPFGDASVAMQPVDAM
eukprot:symbB.v1.2.024621.t1/scaffold2344.1/size81749/8